MTPATRAWWGIAAAVIAWDTVAPTGETLSEQVDRWLTTHRTITLTVIGLVAAHLSNLIPPELDPIHHVATALNRR